MGRTLSGLLPGGFPPRAAIPLVWIKRDWGDAWQFEPTLNVLRATVPASAHDLGILEMQRRYGNLKEPWQTSLGVRQSGTIDNWWVLLGFATTRGITYVWLGQVSADSRDVWGSDETRSGMQTFVGYSPGQTLRKLEISESYWKNPERDGRNVFEDEISVLKLNRPASFNLHFSAGTGEKYKNRSNSKGPNTKSQAAGVSHFFSNETFWTSLDILEYLVARFLQTYDDDGDLTGPTWTLGGQLTPLASWEPILDMSGAPVSVYDLMQKIVPIESGLDFAVIATDDGFQIYVFALSDNPSVFASAIIPANPNHVRIAGLQFLENVETKVVRTGEHVYEKLRLVGQRVVVCTSLWGPQYTKDTTLGGARFPDTLVGDAESLDKGWSDASETSYKAGDVAAGPFDSDNDQLRNQERFIDVYQRFHAAENWMLHAGAASPRLAADGSLVPFDRDGEDVGFFQNQERQTLAWLPLYQVWDYSKDPPEPQDVLAIANLIRRPPQAWIRDKYKHFKLGGGGDEFEARWTRINEILTDGARLSPLDDEWGVRIDTPVNHILARNHFTPSDPDAPEAANAPSKVRPLYDWQDLVATVAFETDRQFSYEIAVPGADPAGGVKVIEIENAEYWVLAPRTFLDLDDEMQPIVSPDHAVVVRNDADKLVTAAAGAMNRYLVGRGRADIVLKGLWPWSFLLGQILTSVDEAGDTHTLRSPITYMEWVISPDGLPLTIIRTGYAL